MRPALRAHLVGTLWSIVHVVLAAALGAAGLDAIPSTADLPSWVRVTVQRQQICACRRALWCVLHGTTGGACERGGGRVMVGIQVGASNRGIRGRRTATKTMQVPILRRARWRQHQSLRAFTCSWLRHLGLFSEG